MRFPVSFAQQRLWFLDQLAPGEPTYNMPYAFWLDGPLDAGALQRAIDALVARHAVLRTTIVAFDGVPEQVVADVAALPVERVELPPGLDDGERTRRAEAIAKDLGCRPFDLAAGPLIRVALIAAGPDRHLFVLVIHHIISDGESMKVLIGELSAGYRAEVTGVPAVLPPLWLEYGDYAAWQQDRMRGEALDRQLSYWRDQLRGAPQVLTLPTDRPRPPRQSTNGALTTLYLDPAVTERLAAVAHGANATMFTAFLTVFVAVLSRYARQADMLIGTQVAGRTHAELEPMLGMFTNTIALRASLAGDPTFVELLGRVMDTTLDGMAHEQLPFEKLVEVFAPDRTLAYTPLIQVQFVYGSLTPPALDLPGITTRARVLVTSTAKLDLNMYADAGDITALSLEYSTDLFDPPWANRFLRCMATLLEHAADAPGTRVADLPMLTQAERGALTAGTGQPAVPDDGYADIRALLQASTSRVIDGARTASMSEVRDRAARIARVLADRGVGLETTVGLCVGRGIDMLTALFGVWWAGGAYVPLDPGFPRARLALMARGAGLRIIVCDAEHHDLASSVADGAEVILVDDPAIAAAVPLDPVPVPRGALAYVIFTSGSTGQPKGVGVEHSGLANLLASFQRALKISVDDRVAAAAALSFDISVFELMLTLTCGADLVIATADEAREPDRLRSLIERTSATVMQATPQTWRLLKSAGGVPAGLRLRLSGAEAIPLDLAEHLVAPGVVLWNLYGPTETAVWSSAGIIADPARAAEIGPPIDNVRVYVLDVHLMPVPTGVVGEVCVAGRGVTRGYHGQPRLTARAFRPDPWSTEPGGRMYRTGDLGRWREDGSLQLIGRNDHQVKIRGFRIECGEVEAALRSHRDVRQAVVVTAPRGGEPALVGYIVPRRGSAAAKPGTDLLEEFRPHLRAALPDYMIPALIVALPALPLTPSAKVDRLSLPAPQWDAQSLAAGRVLPRNPVEATLAQIWSDLLAAEAPVGVHDNLFDLGGHSLTATRLVARIADTYGVNLPVHQVFTSPTVAELAEVLSTDPAFGITATPPRHAELAELSDEDLDELLRAAIAQRNRRRATADDLDTPGTETSSRSE
jgi:amino acid adenylation domain-containing protein